MRHTTSGRIGSTLFALTLGALGCSGAASEAPAANPEMGANTVEPPPDTPAVEPNTQGAAPAPAPAAETAAPADEPAGGEASGEAGPNAPREVKYVITPEGLKVELEGTRFLIKAEPKKIAAGWGVSVKVSAQALDENPHTLANPKNGPLAFSSSVLRKGKTEPEQEGDKREGDGELSLKKGKTIEFKRDWPAKGGKILGIGDAIEIQVGLWGIGESKDVRRPLKQFAKISMKIDHGTPRAKAEPPPNVAR